MNNVKKSDVRRFYNRLVDERVMSISTIDTVQNILHQVFNVAIEDGYMRTIPMMDWVKEAFLLEKQYQEDAGISCSVTIDGYTDFIFINRYGKVQHQGTLNKAIRRITRDCNDEILNNDDDNEFPLLFSCHSLRYTFATRLCEAGFNIKVIQDVLGHKDISTTMDIYVDVTKELKKKEFDNLGDFFG